MDSIGGADVEGPRAAALPRTRGTTRPWVLRSQVNSRIGWPFSATRMGRPVGV
jgi:hypothetical protein